MPVPRRFVPVTMYLDPDLVAFLDSAAYKLRVMGQHDMTRDRLASILCYVGASGQCLKDGARDLGEELARRADALASSPKLPR